MKFYLDSVKSLVAVPVELEGMDTRLIIKMAVDTGATFVMISWNSADHLGYDPATSIERIAITPQAPLKRSP